MNRRNLTVLASAAAALAAFVLAIAPARALTTSSTVTVTASVAKACSIGNATLAFGAYDPTTGTNDDVAFTNALSVSCTKGTAWSVGLDTGLNGPATRNMKDATSGDLLHYELYTDTTRNNVWSNGATITPVPATMFGGTGLGGTGAAAVQNVTIYGRIFASQFVTPAATYQDQVKATVNF
jgi:spore coat protein U-like protein